MDRTSTLREYYANYLVNVRELSEASVKHYLGALNTISHRLKAMDLVKSDLYEIEDISDLNIIRNALYQDIDFKAIDERGNRMYSAGLNNYCRFAQGEGFEHAIEQSKHIDVPIKKTSAVSVEIKTWNRSNILREQALTLAKHRCEINNSHKTFITEKNNLQYMEGHHAIPLKMQSEFDYSLDVYANIICLCPNCHRQIHYGLEKDRRDMMDFLFNKRGDRLLESGISITKKDFREIIFR